MSEPKLKPGQGRICTYEKVFVFGEVAREDFDDPRCLAFWEGKS